MTSGSGEAMFRFSNNITQNQQEIAAGLAATVADVQAAAREMAGTSIPLDWGDQIVRGVSRAAEQTRQALGQMLDPRKLGAAPNVGQISEAATQSAVGSLKHAQVEVDRILRQLGPDAQVEIAKNDTLSPLLHRIAETIVQDAERAYGDFRQTLDAGMRAQVPRTLGADTISHIREQLALQPDGIEPLVEAQRIRAEKLVKPKMEMGETGEMVSTGEPDWNSPNPDPWMKAETRAAEERLKVEAEAIRQTIELGRRQLSEALAHNVGDPGNIYAKALGYHINPETLNPARRRGTGYEDITDPYDVERAMREMQELGDAHQKTLNETFEPIKGTSRFVRQGEGPDATFFEKATRGGIEYYRLLSDVESRTLSAAEAERKYAEEIRKAQEAARSGSSFNEVAQGPVRGFRQGVMSGAFGKGFRGGGQLDPQLIMGNLGTTVGSAARYSLAYGGFYQFTQSLKDALNIFEDYQDSFTDYEVALGSSSDATQSYTNQLMELSRVVGENVGAAYDSAARGIRAFANDMDEADRKAAGTSIATASQKVAVIANKKLGDATGDVIAAGTGFGLTAQQSGLLIPDAVANAKKLGGDPSQISQGLASFATAAQEAGYSLQEAANLVSLVQAKTDESGQAVSTRLSRIVSIVGGTTGKSLAAEINRVFGDTMVDIGALPKEQIEQIATAYVAAGKKGMSSLQGLIRSQLGGTSNLRELLPLLEDQPRLQDALRKSLPGQGDTEYERKTQNLIGTLNKIRGDIQNIVVLAANADLFAPFAAAVGTIEPVLHLLERVLQVYEKIEGLIPGSGVVSAVGEVGLAAYGVRRFARSTLAGEVASSSGVTGAVLRSAGVKGAETREAAGANAAAGATERLAVAANSAAGALGEVAVTGGAHAAEEAGGLFAGGGGGAHRGAGRLRTFVSNNSGLIASAGIVAGLVAFDKAMQNREDQARFFGDLADLQGSTGSTPEQLRNQASALRTLGKNSDKELGGFWRTANRFIDIPGLPGSNPMTPDSRDIPKIANAEADNLTQIAAGVEAENRLAASRKRNADFGDAAARTADSLSESMQALHERGFTAKQSLNDLFKALTQDPGYIPGSAERPKGFSAEATSTITGTMHDELNRAIKDYTTGGPGNVAGMFGSLNLLTSLGGKGQARQLGTLDSGKINDFILKRVQAAGKGLDQAGMDKIVDQAIDQATDNSGFGRLRAVGFNVEKLRNKVKAEARGRIQVLQRQVQYLTPLSPAELDALLQAQQGALAEVDPADPEATGRQLHTNLRQLLITRAGVRKRGTGLRRLKAMGLGDLLGLDKQIDDNDATLDQTGVAIRQTAHDARAADVANAERRRSAAEARARYQPLAVRQAVRQQYALPSFKDAGNDVAELTSLFNSLDKQTVRYLINYRRTALNIDKLALASTKKLLDESRMLLNSPQINQDGGLPGMPGGDHRKTFTDPKIQKKYNTLRKKYKDDNKALNAALKAADEATITSDTAADDALTAGQASAMRAQALRNPDDTIGAAKDNLAVARANLAKLKARGDTNSQEYLSALQAVTQGEAAVGDAVAGHAGAVASAQAARTGGATAAARAQIQTAAAQMHVAARGTTGWWQGLASFYQGQEAMRQAVMQYKNNLDLLHGDSTDPVEQARDALRAAYRQLANARNKDDRAAARVAIQEGKHGLAGSKFDQRFSDMQTAEELGRISFAKYMDYLDHEHERLSRIKHRTRQQQDQLNQVDKAMKDALGSMDSQFNLGDINANGLVYQVRRFKAEAASHVSSTAQLASPTTTQTVTISINGADTAKVKQVIDNYLRIGGGQRTSLTRRKV